MAAMTSHTVLCSNEDFQRVTFDYVIVGGGTAGLVLASRLSEDPKVKVAVLETGKSRKGDENVEGIAGMHATLNNPEYDWVFRSIPQKHNANRVHHVARGKMLGGSSGINFLAHTRPSAEDIDSWESQAPGWSWATLEPYFAKHEMFLPDPRAGERPKYFVQDPKIHGHSGPIKVSWSPTPPKVTSAVVDGVSEVSVPCEFQDPSSGRHQGFAQHFSAVDRRDGKIVRSYAGNGYLEPIMDRDNLLVLTEATAFQILLDGQPLVAKGIKYLYEGREYEVHANREVILSASSIQSPRLLELSGIGDPKVLQAAGIECLVKLPDIGENLQENPLGSVSYELTKSAENITMDSILTNPEVVQAEAKRLAENGEGLLAGATGSLSYLPYATQVSKETLDATVKSVEDIIAQQVSAHYREQGERVIRLLRDPEAPAIEIIGMPCNFNVAVANDDQSRVIAGPPNGSNDCYSLLVAPIYPMSRGRTHITSGKGDWRTAAPEIDFSLLSHPSEVDVMAAGVMTADRAFKTSHMAHRIHRRVFPTEDVNLDDMSQARDFVRNSAILFNHNIGTCAMGRVVDEQLRVKGVANLRVVDCSVIPDQISAHTMATVYALAERAADLIRQAL